MNKQVQILVQEPASEATQEASADNDMVFLKKQKEDEIRMQLDKFARELSQVEKKRNQH